MKSKGDFEGAKSKYLKAIQLNPNDAYSKEELAKINKMTDPDVNAKIEEIIVDLAEQKAVLNSRKREDAYGIFLCEE